MTRMLACAVLCAAGLSAQQVRVAPQLGALGPGEVSEPGEDPGTIVEMFENPNLDNYLRRSQSLLEREDYAGAIELLQDVIEGRTVEVVAIRPEQEQPVEPQPAQPEPQPKDDQGPSSSQLSARNSVYSHDGRIYRPVRRLCHELLSRMPDGGIELYRTKFEYAAEEMLQDALEQGSTTALEQVANRYFITLPAGQAMMLLADRLMHQGRYRGAVQVLRDLLEIYPEQNRRRLGIREVWCEFKIALCLRLAGESDSAQEAVTQLADQHEEESLRILGQLESIRELPDSRLFSRDTVAIDDVPDIGGVAWLDAEIDELVPLWQYRFENPDPYKDPKPSNRNRGGIWIDGGSRSTQMPFANRYGPATWVAFANERRGGYLEPRALFLEHFRLRMTDAASGLLLQQGDGAIEPPTPRENHPRVRIAAVDHALLRPVEDEARRYAILGHQANTTTSNEALKTTTLVAYDRETWEEQWSTKDWLDGEDGLRNVTFLAAPTVFGERLLLPSLRRDAYTLECLDRSNGEPLWHTPLHAGGSPFYKAPGVPVVVQGGVAYVATNAGCIAAVDAFAGDLRWIRRYERLDPIHHRKRSKKPAAGGGNRFGYRQQFTQAALTSFRPSDIIWHDGLLVIAPIDAELVMAIDAATGAPVWFLDSNTHHAPYGRLTNVVGAGDGKLFVTSATHLVCIELAGGLVRWMRKLPTWSGPKYSGRGRGTVAGSTVILPNLRELLLFDVDDQRAMRRLRLPEFDQSREPLTGSCNVVVKGQWLAVGYAAGVEVYSTAAALGDLAKNTDDPLRKSSYLTKSGDHAGAEQVLSKVLATSGDERERARAGRQLLALVRERAGDLARGGDLAAAMAMMDEVRELLSDRELRLNWHLARIEICKAAGDLRAHAAEQQRLYDYMEGRG
ncbi:MAG: PQQ-binding-like beta-propeller repeat protein [Planctomycetes bacterium]|nr:PQQ-binding-like beta-propeller repeat protein [Planctomycetota bacterium]